MGDKVAKHCLEAKKQRGKAQHCTPQVHSDGWQDILLKILSIYRRYPLVTYMNSVLSLRGVPAPFHLTKEHKHLNCKAWSMIDTY